MKILLTGANGYIGRRLLPALLQEGHEVTCMVREPHRFEILPAMQEKVSIVKADLQDAASLESLPKDLDIVYYLVHSLSGSYGSFLDQEAQGAQHFAHYLTTTSARQIIYLGGIVNDSSLSEHLKSRQNVETILRKSGIALTVLRAAIIIGSGSASFEIIRDLVEKLPVMIAPKWLNTRCQPISIRNVITYLVGVLDQEETKNRVFDIGGVDVLTYKQMLLGYAKVRKLQRWILTVPVFSPRISSYWLYFVTSTSYALARNLVESMKNEVVCQLNGLESIVPQPLLSYEQSVALAFERIIQNEIPSSWTDSMTSGVMKREYASFVQVPRHGCLTDRRVFEFERDPQEVLKNIWAIGGKRGWYYWNFLWRIRGFLDKLVGGVGLRRGRRHPTQLRPGDALDFWRVLLADQANQRLLLYAEMKLPGEAWLEFKVREHQGKHLLFQYATFRPRGLWGRLYWYSVLPFHEFIFSGMAKNLISYQDGRK